MPVERLLKTFEARILPVGPDEARAAATLRVEAQRQGRVLHMADALIAGTAFVRDLRVATRHVGDFADLGVDTRNPWNGAA